MVKQFKGYDLKKIRNNASWILGNLFMWKNCLIVILLIGMPAVYASSYATLHLDPVGEVREGSNVTFSGLLTTLDGTPIPHRTIFIEDDTSYIRPNIILTFTTTDSDGKFLTYWRAVPKDNGTPFHFYALFLGGNVYGHTRSETYESVIKLSNQSSTETVPSKTIPTWFKFASRSWYDGTIRDSDYFHAVSYLIDYQVINSNMTLDEGYLPSWLKNDAFWLSDGKISNSEFVNLVQYLIKNQIIV